MTTIQPSVGATHTRLYSVGGYRPARVVTNSDVGAPLRPGVQLQLALNI